MAYRTVITIPKTQSQEKISPLLTVGAEVLTVPEKPYSDPDTYNRIAQRLAEREGLDRLGQHWSSGDRRKTGWLAVTRLPSTPQSGW
jgi:cysteine synthase